MLVFLVSNLNGISQQGYTLNGEIDASQNGKYMYIWSIDYSKLNPPLKDSSLITDGRFRFSGKLETPGLLVSLYLKDHNAFFAQVFIENREIQVKAKFRDSTHPFSYTVNRNNPLNDQFQLWKNTFDSLNVSILRMYPVIDSLEKAGAPESRINELNQERIARSQHLRELQTDFIREHPDMYISLYWLRYRLADGLEKKPRLLEELFENLSPELRRLQEAMALKKTISLILGMQPGKKLSQFAIPDSNGHLISLADFQGKYLLIDFWASWCQPCIEQFPELKELYSIYHQKGLQVLGISLDDNREKWLKGMRLQQLPWQQVSELKGWDSPIALKYDITYIPKTILVDPDGVIIEVDPDLKEKLKELFK